MLGPRKIVERMTFASSSAAIHEKSVKRNIIWACLAGKNAAMSMAKTGSFAPQFMKGAVSRVARRSLGLLSVRVARTPGTAQPPAIPPEMMKAMTELPCRPKVRKTRSSM